MQEYDEDQDGKITFKEIALHGGLGLGTAADFKEKFLTKDGQLNTQALDREYPVMDERGGFSTDHLISALYKVFQASDSDKVIYHMLNIILGFRLYKP